MAGVLGEAAVKEEEEERGGLATTRSMPAQAELLERGARPHHKLSDKASVCNVCGVTWACGSGLVWGECDGWV